MVEPETLFALVARVRRSGCTAGDVDQLLEAAHALACRVATERARKRKYRTTHPDLRDEHNARRRRRAAALRESANANA
jgi:hypothetical protein